MYSIVSVASSRSAETTPPPRWLCGSARDRWLVGTVDEVAQRIEGLRALGVTRVFLQHLNHEDDAMIALVGGRLLPRSGSVLAS